MSLLAVMKLPVEKFENMHPFRQTYCRAVIALMVLFSTIAPACAIGLIPSAMKHSEMTNTTGIKTHDGANASKRSSSHKAHLPCHKMSQNQQTKEQINKTSEKQLLCLDHCLQSLNEPCPTTPDSEFIEVRDNQKEYKLTIARLLNLLPSQHEMMAGTDPPYIISTLPPRNGISTLILTSSRLRF